LPEVIEHKKSGLLFACGDVVDGAGMAVELLQDKATYSRMQQEALRVAREKFPMSGIIAQYEAIYRGEK
jgi:glycosyltransferase involved in cell wall biosynthesis